MMTFRSMNQKEFMQIMDHENTNAIVLLEGDKVVSRNIGSGVYHIFKDDRTHITLKSNLLQKFKEKLSNYRKSKPRNVYYK